MKERQKRKTIHPKSTILKAMSLKKGLEQRLMDQLPTKALQLEEINFVDCLTCNEIKEVPRYVASRICLDCGDTNFIKTA
jgi:hypothetical protein